MTLESKTMKQGVYWVPYEKSETQDEMRPKESAINSELPEKL